MRTGLSPFYRVAKAMKIVQGKSPIYAQEFFAQYKNLLQDTQRLDTFNILFGANTSLNGTDLNTTLMSLNLNKIKPLNKVDIKA